MAIGLIFPGQGSQFVGMVDGWAAHPAAKDVIAEASEVMGQDLVELGRDEQALKRTDVVQPVTLACELAAWAVLDSQGVDVAAAAGHSLGEFAALAAAGVITNRGAFETVRIRGAAMQLASDSGGGAMAALMGVTVEEAQAICAEAAQGDVLLVANENSPLQTVLSGSAAAVERAAALAKERTAKAKAIRLPVAGAFHSPLMEPARQEVEAAIAGLAFAAPRFPVIPNGTGVPTADPDELRAQLLKHLVSPVRWITTMASMQALGVDKLVEAGPGNVLVALAKRCVPDLPAESFNSPA